MVLMLLMLVTFSYSIGRLFAWGLFVGSLFWLAVLHNEISSTETSWKKKRAELKQQGLSDKLEQFMKKSELELWGYWCVLLFTDWFGLFWGTTALGVSGLGQVLVPPLFVLSVGGMGASVVYLGMYFFRVRGLEQVKDK
ncbi:MAG: hypothetical protein NTW32_26520 [Chloroflexi bacterium]|nr:hypothetical protein [Chloroflexota bacterium]